MSFFLFKKECVFVTDVVGNGDDYHRLDVASLIFAADDTIDKDFVGDIFPIPWKKDILDGDRKIVIV